MRVARHPGRWRLAWRDEFGLCGSTSFSTEEMAREAMLAYDRPRCWAAVIHPTRYVFAAEVGTRFADLQSFALVREAPTLPAAERPRRTTTSTARKSPGKEQSAREGRVFGRAG
jgi:hypothetical protein